MSNMPGLTPPEPNPYAPPAGDAGADREPARPVAPPPSGYEAVQPTSSSAGPSYPAPAPAPAPAYPTPSYPTPSYPTPSAPAPAYGSPPPEQTPGHGLPPGAPAYGSPPPGYGPAPFGAGPDPYGTPRPPMDGLSIASFVTSLVGMLVLAGVPSPVGLGLGLASLRRIRRHRTRGRGLAVAGVVIGALGTLLLLGTILVVAVVWNDQDLRDAFQDGFASGMQGGEQGEQTDPLEHYVLRSDLVPGTCVEAYPGTFDLSDAVVVDCATPHEAEVLDPVVLDAPVVTLDDPSYGTAIDACYDRIEAAAPGLLASTGFADVFAPHPDDFARPGGDSAVCLFVSQDADLTGSITAGDLLVGGLAAS